jgi:hypothetical protein
MGHAPSSHVARPTETRASPERRRLSRSSPRPRSARLEATTPAGDNEPLRVQGLMRCRPTTRILEGGIARVHPQRCPARDRVHVRRDSGRAPAKERRGGKSLRHPVDRPPSPAIAFGAGGTHSRGRQRDASGKTRLGPALDAVEVDPHPRGRVSAGRDSSPGAVGPPRAGSPQPASSGQLALSAAPAAGRIEKCTHRRRRFGGLFSHCDSPAGVETGVEGVSCPPSKPGSCSCELIDVALGALLEAEHAARACDRVVGR